MGLITYIGHSSIYCQEWSGGGDEMRESDDLTADLEDLIYDEDSGHPSER